jgi:hypothetical protein
MKVSISHSFCKMASPNSFSEPRMVRQTSLESYYYLKDNKLLNTKQRQVFGTISFLNGATNMEISKFLGWPINCVTPRTRELFQSNKIIDDGERYCPQTKKNHIIWKVRS